MGWLEAHPESQEARDVHVTRQDIRNIQNRVPSNQPKLDRDQVHLCMTCAWLRKLLIQQGAVAKTALHLQAVSVGMLLDAAAAAHEGELLHVSSDTQLDSCIAVHCCVEQHP